MGVVVSNAGNRPRGGGLALWGLTFWSAMITALLLVCPALLLWGAFHLSKQ